MSKPRAAVRPKRDAAMASRPMQLEARRDSLVQRRLRTLVDQLATIRLDLLYGVIPRAERITLTGADLDLVARQLDGAIVTTKAIVAELESGSEDERLRHARSEYRISSGNTRKEAA